MTKEDDIRMAQDCHYLYSEWSIDLDRFAQLIAVHDREQLAKQFAKQAVDLVRRAVQAEREFCARVADEWVQAYEHPSKVIAETIRKRGQI